MSEYSTLLTISFLAFAFLVVQLRFNGGKGMRGTLASVWGLILISHLGLLLRSHPWKPETAGPGVIVAFVTVAMAVTLVWALYRLAREDPVPPSRQE